MSVLNKLINNKITDWIVDFILNKILGDYNTGNGFDAFCTFKEVGKFKLNFNTVGKERPLSEQGLDIFIGLKGFILRINILLVESA